jgi:hypothetical protein
MAEHPAQTVNREFFLSKLEECIRHADEAALPAERVYWLALADRWRTLVDPDFNDGASPEWLMK